MFYAIWSSVMSFEVQEGHIVLLPGSCCESLALKRPLGLSRGLKLSSSAPRTQIVSASARLGDWAILPASALGGELGAVEPLACIYTGA